MQRPTGKLVRARILEPDQGDLISSPREVVASTLESDPCNVWGDRTWHFGGVHNAGEYISGRLGFEKRTDTDMYDHIRKDFTTEAIRQGHTWSFVVRLTDLTVVFERRRPSMKDQSFTSALRRMLCQVDTPQRWGVVSLDGMASFEEWRTSVDIVSVLRYRAWGPRLPDAPLSPVTGMLIYPRPETVVVDLRAPSGVDVDDELVQELVRLANAGIGQIALRGRRTCGGGRDELTMWTSDRGAANLVAEVPVDDRTGEIGVEGLLTELAAIEISPLL